MGHDVPKQFMQLGRKPVILHTIERFFRAVAGIEMVIVLPVTEISRWEEIKKQYRFDAPVKIAEGGKQRFDSVKNGLDLLPEAGLVAIHDAVRPLVHQQVITNSFRLAERYGNAVPAVMPRDSVREVIDDTNHPMFRESLRLIQTPQTFRTELIKKAYEQAYKPAFTDDASVVENLGKRIHLFEGNYENIKITHPADIPLAEALLKLNQTKNGPHAK
ncbi:MAG: 2-C-methyl-D-erythritol 4-phosphate cytidylyltransferase [Bacteroidales bacterium]|nr:2-C-methyl-D-erythritol 4-phosphate cytidylyltransferase [Bacteroidales bacterium]